MLEGLHSFGFYTRNLRMAEMWKKMGPQRVGDCRGLPVNCWGLPGTDRNRRGQPATAGDCGGRPGLPGTARDCQTIHESYQLRFRTPFPNGFRNLLNNRYRKQVRLGRDKLR